MTNSEQTAKKIHYICQAYIETKAGRDGGGQVSKLPSNLNTPQRRKHKTEPNGKLYQRIARGPTHTWSLRIQTAEKLERQVSL